MMAANAITTRVGSARPTFARLIATNEPRCRCPSTTPSGTAITTETARPAADSSRCSQVFSRISARSSTMNSSAADEDVDGGGQDHAVLRAYAQGVSNRCATDEQCVGEDRQSDGERSRCDDLGLEVQAQGAEDRAAESLRDDERGDRRERDRRDDGHADPRDDRGQRERQLDAPQRLRRRQAHPACSFEHLGRGRAEADEDVAEEDQQRVADERHLDRRHGQARDRHEQLEEREARDRVDHRRGDRERVARRGAGDAPAARRGTRSRIRRRRRSRSARCARRAPAAAPDPSCRGPSRRRRTAPP